VCSFSVIGSPPVFGEQQKDVVVHEDAIMDVNGTNVNLILRCNVTGSPEPIVSWFREGTEIRNEGVVLSFGTLGLNVREGNGATREGVIYHCTATNKIGPNNTTAITRSRDIRVSYACEFLILEVHPKNCPALIKYRASIIVIYNNIGSINE